MSQLPDAGGRCTASISRSRSVDTAPVSRAGQGSAEIRPFAVVRALIAVLALSAPFPNPGEAAQLQEFSFTQLNRSYDSIVEELAPIQVGPATVQLRSPTHRLDLHGHTVQLVRGTAEGYGAVLTLDVSGSGTLEADVLLGTVSSQLEDELVLPRQSITLVGRISLARSEEGYVIRPLELPSTVTVQIESRLARQLFVICRPMALVLVNMDCAALESSLNRVEVPLPEVGSAYVLPYAELTAEERLELERFLDG